jgi:hypothetical protein
MKNIAFLLFVWLSAFNSICAQDQEKRIRVGFTTGLTYSKESTSYADEVATLSKEKGLPAYTFGLVGTFKISPRFFLTTQLAYSKARTNHSSYIFLSDSSGAGQGKLQKTHSYSWLVSPVVFNYKFLSKKNCDWFVGLGASPYWLTEAQDKLTSDIQGTHYENTLDITSKVKRLNLFGVAQTGVGFDLKSGGKFLVLLEYHRSLFSLLKKEEPTSPGVFDYATSYPTINLNVFTLRTCFVY